MANVQGRRCLTKEGCPTGRPPSLIRAESSPTHPRTSTHTDRQTDRTMSPPVSAHTHSSFRRACVWRASRRGHRVQPAPWSHYWNKTDTYDVASTSKQRNEQPLHFWAVMLQIFALLVVAWRRLFVCVGCFWINVDDCESISPRWFCLRLCITTEKV